MRKIVVNILKSFAILYLVAFALLIYIGENGITYIGDVDLLNVGASMFLGIVFGGVPLYLLICYIDDYSVPSSRNNRNVQTTRTYSRSSNSYGNYDSYDKPKKEEYKSEEKEDKYLDTASALALGISTEDIINYNCGDYDALNKYGEAAHHVGKSDFFGLG